MIEILKRGTRKKATCMNCGCLFSYEAEDISRNCFTAPNGQDVQKEWVICPQCHEPIYMMQTRDMGE